MRAVLPAALVLAAVLVAPLRCGAADSFYSPTIKGIDTVCDAYRPHAKRDDVLRLGRVAGNDAWSLADEATIARLQTSPAFASGDFATIVLDRGAIVSADLAHVDGTTGRVVLHAWCFIGGKLSRSTADVASTYDRGTGYRRTWYYGDDLDEPLAETNSERGPTTFKVAPPPKDVEALLVAEPDAKPPNLPFYDAFVAARKHALPILKDR